MQTRYCSASARLRRLSFALTKRIETGPAVKVESRAIVNLNLKSEKRGKSRRPPPSPNYRDYAHRTATLASERRGPPPSSRFSRLTASAIWRSRGVPSRRRRVQDPRTVTLPLDSPGDRPAARATRPTRLRSTYARRDSALRDSGWALRSPALTSLRETSERVCNVYSNSLTKKQ